MSSKLSLYIPQTLKDEFDDLFNLLFFILLLILIAIRSFIGLVYGWNIIQLVFLY